MAEPTRKAKNRTASRRAATGGDRLFARRSGLRTVVETLAEIGLRVSAWVSGALVLLVLAFILLEALPTPPSRATEVDTTTSTVPQSYGQEALGPAAHALLEREAGPRGGDAAGSISLSDLLGPRWDPSAQAYGFLPLVVGSLKVSAVALAVGAPLGILAAVFTVMFAPRRLGQTIKPAVELLAGVPTVVIGFLGLVALAPLAQDILGYELRLNAFLAGLAVAVPVIPIVYTTAEDAFWRVPGHLREGSLALGASRWQTTRRMMLPAAAPGILAGIMLGLGRAIGETMIVLMVSGNAPVLSGDLFDSARTMSATLASEMGSVLPGEPHYHALYTLAVVLFVGALLFNVVGAVAIGRGARARWRWQR
jgi:phosphate transport system permease protein